MRLIISVFFMATILCTTSTINAGQRIQSIGYSIEIPDGWIEIPREVLNEHKNTLAQESPSKPKEHYDSGFQSENPEDWFTHPFILTQNRPDGRIHENEVMKWSAKYLHEALKEIRDADSDEMSKSTFAKTYYHKYTNKIWMEIKTTNPDLEQIGIIMGITPTETGYISVTGVSLAKDFEEYKPIFKEAALSVKPIPEIKYKTNWPIGLASRIWISSKRITKIVATLSIILAFIFKWARKKRTRATVTDNIFFEE